ncbi:MAG: thioredoxin domain-containing protein, partial [Blastochloris sp.]|nr:thioredoxin domain-containing protein [Blastochloris sp.]
SAVEYWGVSWSGNFEGRNILYVPNDDAVVAERLGISVDDLRAALNRIRDVLFAARSQRVAPNLDDKVLASWNGMVLASLSEAARVFKRDDYREAAVRNARFIVDQMMNGPRLMRTYKNGVSKIDGFLEDYANVIDGFLELYQTTFDDVWFTHARALADHVLAHFRAPDGGFYDTSDEADALIVRPRSLQDNAVPSGNAMMARNFIRLSAYTGEAAYDEAASAILMPMAAALREYPQAFGEALNAVDLLVRGVQEIAVVGDPAAEATRNLLTTVREPYRPNVIVALAPQDIPAENTIPLLNYRTQRGGQPTVYVCRDFACRMPVTTPNEVAELLTEAQ